MKILFQFFLFLSFSLSQPLETIHYTVKYNNIIAGSASLGISILDDKSSKIEFNLKSKKWIDLIYKLREKITIISDTENFAIKSITKKSNHGRNKKSYHALFDYENLKGEINSKSINLENKIYDPISIIYNLRYQLIEVEDIFKYDILSKNNFKSFEMHVVNKETLKINNHIHDCFVIEAFQITKNNQLKKSDELKLWLNEEKVPIIIEKKAKHGTIKMEIKDIVLYNG